MIKQLKQQYDILEAGLEVMVANTERAYELAQIAKDQNIDPMEIYNTIDEFTADIEKTQDKMAAIEIEQYKLINA